MSNGRQKHGNPAKANGHQKGAPQTPKKSPPPPTVVGPPRPCGQTALITPFLNGLSRTVQKCFSSVTNNGAYWTSLGITFLSALFFLPRVSVDIPPPYDPDHPTPISFTISNTNIIPLKDFQPSIGICYFKPQPLNGTEPSCNGPAGSKMRFIPWHADWFSPDEKYQIFLDQAIAGASNVATHRTELNADITVYVEFSPWYAPWRSSKEFRFVTKKLIDGKTYWTPIPLYK